VAKAVSSAARRVVNTITFGMAGNDAKEQLSQFRDQLSAEAINAKIESWLAAHR
jgi:hypothetical protein